MGGIWGSSRKPRETVLSDINDVNKITNTDLFFKKSGYYMHFKLSNSLLKNLFSSYLVHLKISNQKVIVL
jgi:hypothetical protein